MQSYDWNISNAVALECLADHVGGFVSFDTYRIKQGTAQTHATGAVVTAPFLGGPALRLKPSDAVCDMDGVQVILAVTDGYVDCITGTQAEDTCHPCRNADSSSLTAERDVGSAIMFQQFNHGAKILVFSRYDVLSLEKRQLHRGFTAMGNRGATFPRCFAEHLSEDVEEAGDHDRIACKFIELRIGYTCGQQSVDIVFGYVHQTEALARSKFAYPVFNEGKVIVLPL